jgi:hypothetical protein
VITVAGAHDQQLVPCYAASVFMSLLVGLLAMACLARRKWRHKSARHKPDRSDRRRVQFTLIANPGRGKPRGIASIRATEHDE